MQEKTCEESTSFDLTPYDVASAINAVDRLLVEQAKEISHKDSVSEDVNVESLSSGKKTFAYTHVPNRVFHLILRVCIVVYECHGTLGYLYTLKVWIYFYFTSLSFALALVSLLLVILVYSLVKQVKGCHLQVF